MQRVGAEESVLKLAFTSNCWKRFKDAFGITGKEEALISLYYNFASQNSHTDNDIHEDHAVAEHSTLQQSHQDNIDEGNSLAEPSASKQVFQAVKIATQQKKVTLRTGDWIEECTSDIFGNPHLQIAEIRRIRNDEVLLSTNRSYGRKHEFRFYTTFVPENSSVRQVDKSSLISSWNQIKLINDENHEVEVTSVYSDSVFEDEQMSKKKLLSCVWGSGNHYYVPLERFPNAGYTDNVSISCSSCHPTRTRFICVLCSIFDAPIMHGVCANSSECKEKHESGASLAMMQQRHKKKKEKKQPQKEADAVKKGEGSKEDNESEDSKEEDDEGEVSNEEDDEGEVSNEEDDEGEVSNEGEDAQCDLSQGEFDLETQIFIQWTHCWNLESDKIRKSIVKRFKVTIYL